jgi:hypothetical protein
MGRNEGCNGEIQGPCGINEMDVVLISCYSLYPSLIRCGCKIWCGVAVNRSAIGSYYGAVPFGPRCRA